MAKRKAPSHMTLSLAGRLLGQRSGSIRRKYSIRKLRRGRGRYKLD